MHTENSERQIRPNSLVRNLEFIRLICPCLNQWFWWRYLWHKTAFNGVQNAPWISDRLLGGLFNFFITFPCLHKCCAETDINDFNHPVEHEWYIHLYIHQGVVFQTFNKLFIVSVRSKWMLPLNLPQTINLWHFNFSKLLSVIQKSH